MKTAIAFTVLSVAVGAAAHGAILEYQVDGKVYNGFVAYNTPDGQSSIQRIYNTFDPIQDVSLQSIACNDNGQANPGQLTAPIAAGKTITGFWNDWPHPTGPLIAYLAKCPGTNCDSSNPNELDWFKIAEEGLLSGTVAAGVWAAADMVKNNNSWAVVIPETVPSGNYIFRMETIALHSLPAQSYPECAQIEVTGGGNVEPPANILVKFPGAYQSSDPGLDININDEAAKTSTTYVIPGPPLYPGDGSAPETPSTTLTGVPAPSDTPSTTAPTSSETSSTDVPAPSETPSTSVPAPSETPSTSTTAPGATATLYGQCGGFDGYAGPTACPAGTICQEWNPYYSQCIPAAARYGRFARAARRAQ
ncbi:cellulose-growth-specific protein [Auriculariales sp. MPI-PUGE-AT-0066]|nr:cellulose-growth-specific protein [Auriculariales sp. MPI-PUGE-AT-0066]